MPSHPRQLLLAKQSASNALIPISLWSAGPTQSMQFIHRAAACTRFTDQHCSGKRAPVTLFAIACNRQLVYMHKEPLMHQSI